MQYDAGRRLNPWVSMWTKPRATIQQIVDDDPRQRVLFLAAIGGFGEVLDRASGRSFGDRMDFSIILLLAAFVGPIGGILSLYLFGAILTWTGKWLGGIASMTNIRAAMAWCTVPTVWALPIWIPELLLFGSDMFTTETPRIDANPAFALLLLGLACIQIFCGVWTFVVSLKCVGQVQGFSAWKALGNLILAGLVLVVPAVLIGIGVAVLTSV